MRDEVRLRVLQAAEHILETNATVRVCAAKFGVSKTTIHKDMRQRLPKLDSELSKAVDSVLKQNLQERHLRGGEATRQRWRGRGDGGNAGRCPDPPGRCPGPARGMIPLDPQ